MKTCKMRHTQCLHAKRKKKHVIMKLLYFRFQLIFTDQPKKMPSATHLTVPSVDQNGHALPHSSSDVSLSSFRSITSINSGVVVPKKKISKFRQYLPQILAVSVKNVLLLAYGMTLGIATIVIPAVSDPEAGDDELSLTKTQISWFSK